MGRVVNVVRGTVITFTAWCPACSKGIDGAVERDRTAWVTDHHRKCRSEIKTWEALS